VEQGVGDRNRTPFSRRFIPVASPICHTGNYADFGALTLPFQEDSLFHVARRAAVSSFSSSLSKRCAT
jgi:hypothetical protein